MKNNGKYLLGLAIAFSLGLSMCQLMPTSDNEVVRNPADFEKKPKPVIVAVIDTGFDFKSDWKDLTASNPKLKKPRMCKYGHKDYTGLGIEDHHGHGTHIAGTIAQYADGQNYCIVSIKFYDDLKTTTDPLDMTRRAIQRAINLKVDIINYSGGGNEKSETECKLLKKALDLGIIVVAAAGNEKANINKQPYYPAMCDSRIIAVANVEENGAYAKSSNYSNDVEKDARGLVKEKGMNVLSILPNNQAGYMTGTSQAAAIQTGKIIKNWKNH